MTRFRIAAAFATAAAMAAQPVLAAEDFRDDRFEQRTAAFAGASLRVPLGATKARPSLRLQATTALHRRGLGTSELRTERPAGLEVGAGRSGKPALYLGGEAAPDVEKRLNAGSTTTLLIVGGIVLLVAVAAAVASAMPTAGPPEDAF